MSDKETVGDISPEEFLDMEEFCVVDEAGADSDPENTEPASFTNQFPVQEMSPPAEDDSKKRQMKAAEQPVLRFEKIMKDFCGEIEPENEPNYNTGIDCLPCPAEVWQELCPERVFKELFGYRIDLDSLTRGDAASRDPMGRNLPTDPALACFGAKFFSGSYPVFCSNSGQYNWNSVLVTPNGPLNQEQYQLAKPFLRKWSKLMENYRSQVYRTIESLENTRLEYVIELAIALQLFTFLAGASEAKSEGPRFFVEMERMVTNLKSAEETGENSLKILGFNVIIPHSALLPKLREDAECILYDIELAIRTYRPRLKNQLKSVNLDSFKSRLSSKLIGPFQTLPEPNLTSNISNNWSSKFRVRTASRCTRLIPAAPLSIQALAEYFAKLDPAVDQNWLRHFAARWRLFLVAIRQQIANLCCKISTFDKVECMRKLFALLCLVVDAFVALSNRNFKPETQLPVCHELAEIIDFVPYGEIRSFCVEDLRYILEDLMLTCLDLHGSLLAKEVCTKKVFEQFLPFIAEIGAHDLSRCSRMHVFLDALQQRHPEWNFEEEMAKVASRHEKNRDENRFSQESLEVWSAYVPSLLSREERKKRHELLRKMYRREFEPVTDEKAGRNRGSEKLCSSASHPREVGSRSSEKSPCDKSSREGDRRSRSGRRSGGRSGRSRDSRNRSPPKIDIRGGDWSEQGMDIEEFWESKLRRFDEDAANQSRDLERKRVALQESLSEVEQKLKRCLTPNSSSEENHETATMKPEKEWNSSEASEPLCRAKGDFDRYRRKVILRNHFETPETLEVSVKTGFSGTSEDTRISGYQKLMLYKRKLLKRSCNQLSSKSARKPLQPDGRPIAEVAPVPKFTGLSIGELSSKIDFGRKELNRLRITCIPQVALRTEFCQFLGINSNTDSVTTAIELAVCELKRKDESVQKQLAFCLARPPRLEALQSELESLRKREVSLDAATSKIFETNARLSRLVAILSDLVLSRTPGFARHETSDLSVVSDLLRPGLEDLREEVKKQRKEATVSQRARTVLRAMRSELGRVIGDEQKSIFGLLANVKKVAEQVKSLRVLADYSEEKIRDFDAQIRSLQRQLV